MHVAGLLIATGVLLAITLAVAVYGSPQNRVRAILVLGFLLAGPVGLVVAYLATRRVAARAQLNEAPATHDVGSTGPWGQ